MLQNEEDQVVDEEIVIDNETEEETTENPVVSEEISDNEERPETIQEEDAESEDDEEDRIVTIGDDEETSEEQEHIEAPGWVKALRKKDRRLESEVKQLRRQLAEKEKAKEKPIELGKKPTLASCDYDDSKYEQELISYYERKRKVEAQEAQKLEQVKEQQKRWQGKQSRYVEQKKEHNFKDYADSEAIVENTLSIAQQQIILQGADDAALLVYALGKNPKKLEELSDVKDPVEFAFRIAKVESQLKVKSRKAPKPERKVATGKAGGISGSSDKTLERLREEAAKTGDYTKVSAYKRNMHKGYLTCQRDLVKKN